MFKNTDDVRAAQQELEFSINEFLRRAGWRYTSDTPGSFWLWEKTFGNRTLLVDTKHAVSIQQHLEDL